MDFRRGTFVCLLVALVFCFACGEAEVETGDVTPQTDGDTSAQTDGDNEATSDGDTSHQCPPGYTYNDTMGGCYPDSTSDGDLDDELEDDADGVDEATEGDIERPPVTAACDALVEGWNTNFMVDGAARGFILSLPTNAGSRDDWPVIFNWHGYGDSADNMAGLIQGLVNNADFPFIGVTPDDLNLHYNTNPIGLDWAMASVDQNNMEARLFDEVLACLEAKWGIDSDHIHSVGFSAGAITTDLLGVVRGNVLASVASISGAYFSNADNMSTLGMLTNYVSWPSNGPNTSSFVQLLVHGGPTDKFGQPGLFEIFFDQIGMRDVGYLNGLGHDVIHCDHGGGHTLPAGVQGNQIINFFKDHPKDVTDSPYASGLPGNFPNYCTFEEMD